MGDPAKIHTLLIWWKDWKLKGKKKMIWEFIPFAVLWTIWNQRNQCVFEEVSLNWEEVK